MEGEIPPGGWEICYARKICTLFLGKYFFMYVFKSDFLSNFGSIAKKNLMILRMYANTGYAVDYCLKHFKLSKILPYLSFVLNNNQPDTFDATFV